MILLWEHIDYSHIIVRLQNDDPILGAEITLTSFLGYNVMVLLWEHIDYSHIILRLQCDGPIMGDRCLLMGAIVVKTLIIGVFWARERCHDGGGVCCEGVISPVRGNTCVWC